MGKYAFKAILKGTQGVLDPQWPDSEARNALTWNAMNSTLAATPPDTAFTPNKAQQSLLQRLNRGFVFRLFLLAKMPIAWIAGLRLVEIDGETCKASMPYWWLSQNPFRSTYFATQAMAAELSTGALAMVAIEAAQPSISMLVTGMEASYGKKATRKATFTCSEGHKIHEAVQRAIASGEGQQATVESVGRMADGSEVSRFRFTWSFKVRTRS